MSEKSPKFIHLHTHSHYSLLTALPKINELIEYAIKYKMPALALTDNGNLYGAMEFYKKCKQANIKPIIGIDAYVAIRNRFDKEAKIDNKRSRLVLLAKNNTGYKNLLKLVTYSHLEGFYYKPRVDKELLEKYSEGLVAILPSFSGETTIAIKEKDTKKAWEILKWYKKIFGDDNIFLEITHHAEIENHQEIQDRIKKFATETNTPLVAGQDVYYMKVEDKKTRDVLMKIQTNLEFGTQNNENEDFSFINQKIACEYFKDTPSALENTIKIMDMCNVELELGKWVFPNLKIESKLSYDDELRAIVYDGLKKRGMEKTKEIEERIEYELKIIKDKGYAPYFLVVADLLKFAHKNNILTTIRGSVSGSLITYLAQITNVNPIEYKIPFERFLNPERPSAPDIDMDFADNRRDEVIQYAKDKYGEEKVAQIGTFGTMMARGSVRDIARALGYPYNTGDRIAKLIPMGSQGFPMTIDKALEITSELKELYKKEKDAKEIIDMAKKIEGNARHISIHAAGVVIAPDNLTNFVPLQFDPKGGKIVTQYDMHSVEDAGLLKFDFLGIKNLAILADSVKRAKKFHNIDIDIENIPLDDKKTYEMLARGETMGLFQLNGAGMTKYLKDLVPTKIHDINAMVALYRPGPMQFIPLYIERKHNSKLITYLDPAFEKILSQTYGVLVYQDDLLIMVREFAGYSWKEVDKFRKAIGKKIPKEMQAQKDRFINGCIETSKWSKNKAEQIWQWIEPFAAYGFNKAHSVSYGKVAYQTAYMKANFPIEYLASVLTADSGDVDKISQSIIELKRMKIPVLPPNINESFGGFTVVEKSIRFGLYSIKNFGEGIADFIIKERENPPVGGGKFKSLADFLERILNKNLNKKSLEALIKSGALDEFGERGEMLFNIEYLLQYNKEHSNMTESQDSLFGMLLEDKIPTKLNMQKTKPASQSEKIFWEKELLGFYISGHPLDRFKEKLENKYKKIKEIKETMKNGMTVVVSGIVEECKIILTKKGDQMAFVKIADMSDSVETVFFPEIFAKNKTLVEQEKCIAIKGKLSARNGGISIIAEAVKEL